MGHGTIEFSATEQVNEARLLSLSTACYIIMRLDTLIVERGDQ